MDDIGKSTSTWTTTPWPSTRTTRTTCWPAATAALRSWDLGQTWKFVANLPVTQFYKVAVDYDEPFYNVYGGTQDNNTQGGPVAHRDNVNGIRNGDWFRSPSSAATATSRRSIRPIPTSSTRNGRRGT